MSSQTDMPEVPRRHCFRLRFRIPRDEAIKCEEVVIDIPTGDSEHRLQLTGADKEKPIDSARWLVLTGADYTSQEEARRAGAKARDALRRCSIKSGVPIDLGDDKASGGFSKYMKDKIQAETGIRVIDDVHGLLIYDGACETWFARLSGSLTAVTSVSTFLAPFEATYAAGLMLTARQGLAFTLLASAGFEPSARSRFLTLVMAIEALLEPESRQEAAQSHVRSLIQQTRESPLQPRGKNSLIGSLQWLLKDSITRTGKKLATRLLGDKRYADRDAASFFTHCYALRSQLVHCGRTADQSTEISAINAELRRFVTDLLDASIEANTV